MRNSASLAFIDGIPIYERFFLGDEFTIRGYNVRSIGPIVPLDSSSRRATSRWPLILSAQPYRFRDCPPIWPTSDYLRVRRETTSSS